jgi:hypothetical protein
MELTTGEFAEQEKENMTVSIDVMRGFFDNMLYGFDCRDTVKNIS